MDLAIMLGGLVLTLTCSCITKESDTTHIWVALMGLAGLVLIVAGFLSVVFIPTNYVSLGQAKVFTQEGMQYIIIPDGDREVVNMNKELGRTLKDGDIILIEKEGNRKMGFMPSSINAGPTYKYKLKYP